MRLLDWVQKFLEKLDHLRDETLFLFIKPYWPRKITPNMLTWIRVFIGLLMFVSLFFFGFDDKTFILSIFCVGVLTDLFDGSVARGTNQITEFGAMLDSTADRLLILPIAIYSLFSADKWLLLVLLIMEIVNAFTSIFYKSKEIYLESNIFGKTKMVLQSVVFIAILIHWPNSPSSWVVDALWGSVIFTILSIFSRIIELKSKGHIKNKILNKTYNIKKHENL